jgi:glycosyltransferase involved in cell wall biosynthesis
MNWIQAKRYEATNTSSTTAELDVSVVCPFYNEATIIGDAVKTLLDKLETLDASWELIVVNDGSRDDSCDIVSVIAEFEPRLRLLSYPQNRGRGYALRTGIARARGNIIVTTEIDLSWGDDIVARLYDAMIQDPNADIIVASPNLPGGGYKNVPEKRVQTSRMGNLVIRALMSNAVTMNTGMTRVYRREVIQSMPLEEDRKEFHLEVIMKAQAMNYQISEIPCVLEWKEYKYKGQRVERKSSSKVKKLVLSHSLFSLFANPIRYVWGLGAAAIGLSIIFFIWSLIRLVGGEISVFTVIISLSLAIIAVLLFAFGVIAQQGFMVQREIWTLKRDMVHLRHPFELGEVVELTSDQDFNILTGNGDSSSVGTTQYQPKKPGKKTPVRRAQEGS